VRAQRLQFQNRSAHLRRYPYLLSTPGKRSEKTAKCGLSPRVSSENLIADQKTKIVSSALDHSLEEQVMKWRHNE